MSRYSELFSTPTRPRYSRVQKILRRAWRRREQVFRVFAGGGEEVVRVRRPEHRLAVGTLQKFLDEYRKAHKEIGVDYIHGEAGCSRSPEGRGRWDSFMRE